MNQQGWLPYRLKAIDQIPQFEWLYFGNKPFTEPFLDDTIGKCLTFPENSTHRLHTTDISALIAAVAHLNALVPSCIIFHTSRCGSTILSQLLAADKNNTVLAEAPLFDDILRFPFRTGNVDFNVEQCLQASSTLYGNHHQPMTERVLIKTDSWHLHFYKTYRKIYPTAQFVLLYRHPLEIIKSHQQRRGMQSVPNLLEPALLGIDEAHTTNADLDSYLAMVLSGYYRQMIEILENDAQVIAFNYDNGMVTMIETIYRSLKINLNKDIKQSFIKRLAFHGKYPENIFTRQTTDDAVPLYLLEADKAFRKLEAKATTKNAG